MIEFLNEYSYIAYFIIFLLEHLIAKSKIKSNSTIELFINVLRYVFPKKK